MLKPASACKKLGWRLMVVKKVILRFVIANQDGYSQKVVAETNVALRLKELNKNSLLKEEVSGKRSVTVRTGMSMPQCRTDQDRAPAAS